PEGVRDAEGRRSRDCRRDHRVRTRPARALQVPRRHRVRRAAEDVDRKGAEVRAPRAGVGRLRDPHRSRVMATATRTHLLVDIDPPTARITLNRPEKRNALSLALIEKLIAA